MYARYRVKLRSKLRTPLQSDTIFGHLCWGILYLKGEDALESFLAAYDDEPPILISSAVSRDKLPRPVMPLSRQSRHRLVEEHSDQAARFEKHQKLKKVSKVAWMDVAEWMEFRNGLSQEKITAFLMERTKDRDVQSSDDVSRQVHRAHNSISRLDGRVLQPGGLYFIKEEWFYGDRALDVYCRFAEEQYQDLWDEVWARYIVPTGFGRDKSTGAGQLDIQKDEDFDPGMFELDGANAWMTLSHTAPHSWENGLDGWYKTGLKFGKLGGAFAVTGPEGGKPNPFKKPIIMILPGGVIKGTNPPTGRLLSDIHLDQKIRHYGIPLCLPARLGGVS